MAGLLNNLNIDMEGTEEEVVEGLEVALGMYVDGYGNNVCAVEGEEDNEGTLQALGAL